MGTIVKLKADRPDLGLTTQDELIVMGLGEKEGFLIVKMSDEESDRLGQNYQIHQDELIS
ncbi:hypothetical protein EOM86_03560 [Candidatus Nomurabacteria bacterium]|nr:hypothetical protein [Candidatus Nomurabacteria bacterium]